MADYDVPRLDLRLLRQFVAVAEELHFTRAAQRLAMAQPSLTAAVQRLEQDVGAVLVERGRKTMRLTPAGAVLLDQSRQLLKAADDALALTRDAAAGRHGQVRLGYVGSAMYGRLPGQLRAFRRAFPDVRIDLQEMTTIAQVAALRSGALDLAIVIPPLADTAALHTLPFDEDRLSLALPMGHRLARAAKVTVADLADEPFLSWPRAQGPGFHDQVMQLCRQAGFAPQVEQEAHGMHAVLSLVAAAAGVAIVPASMAQVRAAEIAYHPITDDAARFELLLCRPGAELAPATRRLEEALQR
ncbi:LysR substrate-binding domain-containing protein [Croceibacterium xixiisoli]|uniref:LysR substrate-binding domain-containing protein n=1 Tax=Croceibacterium xixiisoli TaxID=1476466 RepID=UPI001F33ACEC|nr:LysR substrate-binding domain-containing protein [Croceibacterium xixiisoli]